MGYQSGGKAIGQMAIGNTVNGVGGVLSSLSGIARAVSSITGVFTF
jgi:hypothetical protein